jgi:hypothetical protein
MAVGACEDHKGGAKPTGGEAEVAVASGSCDVTVDGAVKMKDHGAGGPSAVATDYWMNDADLRAAITALEKDPARVEEALKSDPRLMTLLMNCNGEHVNIAFMPRNGSKYADVPHGPKKYDLVAETPGAFQVIFLLDQESYSVKSGSLDVTRFDDTGIAGAFALAATKLGGTEQVKVTGTFDFPCPAGYSKCKR